MKIEKSKGITPTEQRLSSLCERTFLKLWSWPNLYKQDRKEQCDLLAVFGDHVFVFFDRVSQVLEDTGKDIKVTWTRWKKQVIDQQIRAADGATRYLKNSQQIYLDNRCQRPFPVTLSENPTIHKIIVARGAEDACKSFSVANVSGSLAMRYGDLMPDSRLPFFTPFLMELEKIAPFMYWIAAPWPCC